MMEVFYILCLLAVCFTGVELVQVNVTQGILEGEVLTSVTNVEYYSFKGIPYAAPPIGTLRFKAPQAPLSWDGVKSATAHRSISPQVDIFTNILYPGSEDCLFLNVYTPTLTPTTALPVMVYIHGGGSKIGSGNVDAHGPDYFMNSSIVLVTLNYRLEALGFLSLGTEDVPGNAGLKDQVAALKWVQENIVNFGGDPNQVTLFGQSAGAASIGYHILSPMSKGLFNRAILMSGVPLCKQLGIDTNDTTVLLNYLQSLSSDSFYNLSPYVMASEQITHNLIKMYEFLPVVENDFGTNSSFLTQDPWEILKNGTVNDVDVIIGHTNQETLTITEVIVSSYLALYDRWAELLTPVKMLVKYNADTNLNVSKMIRQHYFSNSTIDNSTLSAFINVTSDMSFVYDINRFAAALSYIIRTSSNNTKYFYTFSAVYDLNIYGNSGLPYNLTGAAHLDDLIYIYIFNAESANPTISMNSTEYALIERHVLLFTNFAKYGNPTPTDCFLYVTWPQYNNTDKFYLDIGNTLDVGSYPDAETLTFWESVFDSVGLSFY